MKVTPVPYCCLLSQKQRMNPFHAPFVADYIDPCQVDISLCLDDPIKTTNVYYVIPMYQI